MARENKSRKLPQRTHRALLLRAAEHFREHKKGIPEWLKNSDDSYTRHEDDTNKDLINAPIILNINKKEVCCLDFGGATSEKVIEHLPHYGSPDAATYGQQLKSKSVSGGHGSGGKYYVLSQFKDCKIINYYLGKLTILRINKEAEYVDVEDEKFSPWEAIREAGFEKWDYFDKEGIDLFKKINNGKLSFFCWRGLEPKDKASLSDKRKVQLLLSSVSNYSQSRSAFRSRNVTALLNGSLLWPNMKPEEAEIDESFGTREFALPNEIGGYRFNKYFNSTLKVSLSKKPLTGDKSSLNILEIDSEGKNIAYYNLSDFMMDKGISKSLIAHIDCPELKKDYNKVSEDRVHLIEGEITSLFLEWCRSKINEVLQELTNKEKKIAEEKSLEVLGSFINDIVDEVSDLLDEDLLKPMYNKEGKQKSKVEAFSSKPGYGGEGNIETRGGGQRKGKEEREANSEEKKRKSKLQIKLSNYDEDPLNHGKKYDMIERQPVLFQRKEDVDYGIWWINSQKKYIKKLANNLQKGDENATPFYFFLIKEIVLSHRLRRRFKEQELYDPDSLEELNFDLIDNIFNKIAERLGIDFDIDKNIADKIREAIKRKEKFTISEISGELKIDVPTIHSFIHNPGNNIMNNFEVKKVKIGGKRGNNEINLYVKK